MRRLALACLCLAACGGGDSPPAAVDSTPPVDTPPPATCATASVTGSVAGNTLVPTNTLVLATNLVEIILTEGDGTCSGPPSSGSFLSLQLCPGMSLIGEHAIVNTVNCPDTTAAALFVDPEALNIAVSGTVTITSEVDGCTTGSFSVTYPNNETLAGTFSAQACP